MKWFPHIIHRGSAGALFVFFCVLPLPLCAQQDFDSGTSLSTSLLLETEASLNRGAGFLLEHQMGDGSWSRHPAITSYAALALANMPDRGRREYDDAFTRAVAYLAEQSRDDGGIWSDRTQQYKVYSTAIGMLALIRAQQEKYHPHLHKARQYLLKAQRITVPETDPCYGGFGIHEQAIPDLTTTQYVLEALHLAAISGFGDARKDALGQEAVRSAYRAAIIFISRCQGLGGVDESRAPGAYRQPPGWFVDRPLDANEDLWVGSASTPRGIGFLTFAGLKSLLHSGVPPQDRRVQAAFAWAKRHYTVEENPGLGMMGFYTYLYTMAKALNAYESQTYHLAGGPFPDWRNHMAAKLLTMQHGTGRWLHDDPRWFETHAELVTAYAMLTLQAVCGRDLRDHR